MSDLMMFFFLICFFYHDFVCRDKSRKAWINALPLTHTIKRGHWRQRAPPHVHDRVPQRGARCPPAEPPGTRQLGLSSGEAALNVTRGRRGRLWVGRKELANTGLGGWRGGGPLGWPGLVCLARVLAQRPTRSQPWHLPAAGVPPYGQWWTSTPAQSFKFVCFFPLTFIVFDRQKF